MNNLFLEVIEINGKFYIATEAPMRIYSNEFNTKDEAVTALLNNKWVIGQILQKE